MHAKYTNDEYNFEAILLNKFRNRFPTMVSFENMHALLHDGSLTVEERAYYNRKVRIFGKNDRDSVFVREFYHLFDTDYTFLGMYIAFLQQKIKPLFPGEKYIVVQKTPNIRFHLPGYSNIGRLPSDPNDGIIGLHTDRQFNHPVSELNIILPITDMFGTNSIYYEQVSESTEDIDKFTSLELRKNEFFTAYLNGCRHYNKINETGQTRVSFDFRVCPYSSYVNTGRASATNNTKFILGEYYMLLS